MSIVAGSEVTIIGGVNRGRKGKVQAGQWPNKFGNYGVDILQTNGSYIGYWIGIQDMQLINQVPKQQAQVQQQAPATQQPVAQQPVTQQPVTQQPAAPVNQQPAPTNPADSNWQRLTDPASGKPYYYNKVTKQSSWNPPS